MRRTRRRRSRQVGVICVLLWAGLAVPAVAAGRVQSAPPRPDWYVKAGAIHRVTLKPTTKYWRFPHLSLKPDIARRQMLQWKHEGITALEVFAPAYGGNSYDGLDAKDYFRLDPGLGPVSNFTRVVKLAHSLGMKVVVFLNLGYSALGSRQFQNAEDEVQKSEQTDLTRMFLWSKSQNSPEPVESNSYFFCRPELPGYDALKGEFWQWSSRANAYYWTKWPGTDSAGRKIRLPQYDWGGAAWPKEAAKVVRFWMNTGIDGMIFDAVNWYVGADWKKVNEDLTRVMASYGNEFSQPEGGGGFGDNPVAWITEGNFTNVYDYGLGIWWNPDKRPLINSIEHSNPAAFENALRGYHDPVVAAGGTLYFPVPKLDNSSDQQFAEALIATSGDMPCYCDPVGKITDPAEGITKLLKLKVIHPGLYQDSLRRRIPTSDDAQVYAIERYASDDSERLLLVFNFSKDAVHPVVGLGAVDGARFVDVFTGREQPAQEHRMTLTLGPHAYRIFEVKGYYRVTRGAPIKSPGI